MIHNSDLSTPSYTYKVQVCNDLVVDLTPSLMRSGMLRGNKFA
jgi:hypothetical protein